MNKRIITIVWTLMGWLTLVFSNPIESYKVNEDSTVSFCYCGIARRVRVQGDFLYVGENSSRYRDNRIRSVKMQLQSDGCFHATIRPLQTETYTYSFRVNGKHKTDPFNRDTVWQMTDKWSIVSLGGTPQTDLYLPSKVRGQLIQTKWYDREEQLNRRVNIYLPAAYVEEMTNSSSTRQFPVLYLLHGINGYEGSWAERGRAIQIIENLIDQGQIEPLIVVMPDCNTGIHEDRPSHHTLWNNVWHYNRLCHDHNLEIALEDLMQHIDTTYRVSDQRSIAGLSSGARIAANIGSGQAVVTMPIMTPIADMINMTRQVAVFCFQIGDGVTNLIYPTMGGLLAMLALVRVPFDRWFRFAFPLVVKVTILGCIIMTVAIKLGWN